MGFPASRNNRVTTSALVLENSGGDLGFSRRRRKGVYDGRQVNRSSLSSVNCKCRIDELFVTCAQPRVLCGASASIERRISLALRLGRKYFKMNGMEKMEAAGIEPASENVP